MKLLKRLSIALSSYKFLYLQRYWNDSWYLIKIIIKLYILKHYMKGGQCHCYLIFANSKRTMIRYKIFSNKRLDLFRRQWMRHAESNILKLSYHWFLSCFKLIYFGSMAIFSSVIINLSNILTHGLPRISLIIAKECLGGQFYNIHKINQRKE